MIENIITSISLCLNVILIYIIFELRKSNRTLKNKKIIDEEKIELKNTIMELQESFKEKSIETYLYKDKLNRVRKLFKDDKNITGKFDDIDRDVDRDNIYQEKKD